jgi:uncharacterized membrane protein
MVIGLGLFALAIGTRSDDLKRGSLVLFFAIALLSIPTFVTGTAAQLKLSDTPGVSKTMMETHESAAFVALGFMELTGALAWLGLWQYRRRALLPKQTVAAVLVVGLAAFSLMSRAALLGGEIRHPEVRMGPPSAESENAAPPISRVIGAAMSELKWYWPAAEAVHFIGLCLLFGIVLLVDLRMLGFLEGISYSALHRLLPWGVLGFGVNVATGMLFFIGAPPNFYVTSAVFFWKLALILVAGANALYFTVFEQPWTLEAGDNPPTMAKFAAAFGIVLWVGIIFCGQMLPFIGRSF